MNKDFYFDVLYPLQDHVLGILSGLETGFYLSGGTAASRGYLHHRWSHIGSFRDDPILGRIDSPENILANKVTALVDRDEPKDLADIWGFCCRLGLPLASAIEGAGSRAAGIFPADVARRLCAVTGDDWKLVRWIEPPDPERYVSELVRLGEKLIL